MGKITKEAATRILDATPRTVERLVKDGKLSVTYEKGKTRDVPMYDEDEVRALAEKPRTAAQPTVMPPDQETSQAIATASDISDKTLSLAVAFVEKLSTLATQPKSQPRANVGEKILLTLADAAALSSLSEHHIREAIRAGKLKGKIIGKGYKIKRADLDSYIKKL